MENTTRKTRGDKKNPATLWCYSYLHVTYVYGVMVHSTTHESPDYQWYGTRRSIHDFRVRRCHIEDMRGTHLTNLAERAETCYFKEPQQIDQ